MLDVVEEFITKVTDGWDFIMTGISYGGLLTRGYFINCFSGFKDSCSYARSSNLTGLKRNFPNSDCLRKRAL
jgi:hypothetical protein